MALEVLTALGATYRLCWCQAVSFSCSRAEDFDVDFGSLELRGPPQLSARTCVSGRPCAAELPGLEAGDRVVILETCGARAAHEADPSTVHAVAPRGGATAVARASADSAVSADGETVAWPLLRSYYGTYRLCWCRGDRCDAAPDFLTDVGSLLVVGPRYEDRTCVSGRRCDADDEAGRLVVLDTCGVSAAVPDERAFLNQAASAFLTLPAGQYPEL